MSPDIADIADIKQQHHDLFERLQDNASYYRANQAARDDFVVSVKALLARIRVRVKQPLDSSEYYWMRDAIKAWQIAFAAVLQSGEHVDALPGLIQQPSVAKELNAADIDRIIDDYSNRRYQDRKEEKREAELLRLQKTFFFSTEAEYKEDMFSATVWLASEFLFKDYTGVDLQLSPTGDLLDFLSRVWLHDVVKFRAFLHWENTQRPLPADPVANYFLILNRLRGMMWEKEKYISESASDTVAAYLLENYCSETESCRENRRKLVQVKADRSWVLSRCEDRERNYFHALNFVERFYGNAVAAIRNKGEDAKNHVLAAFHMSEGKNYFSSIVNCLEASILMYFVRGLRELEELRPQDSKGVERLA